MYEGIIQDLIDEFGKLPGIGPKSAQRITFFVLQTQSYDPSHLAELLSEIRNRVKFCEICGNVSETEVCGVCADPRRDTGLICVVEEPKDIVAIERTRQYRGRYHVLGGAISPIDGIGPDDLNIQHLMKRVGRARFEKSLLQPTRIWKAKPPPPTSLGY